MKPSLITYEINKSRNVFHIYIPDTLFTSLKKLNGKNESCVSKLSKLNPRNVVQLVGLWSRAPSTLKPKDTEQRERDREDFEHPNLINIERTLNKTIIVNLLGLKIISEGDGEISKSTPHQPFVQIGKEVNVIGEALIGNKIVSIATEISKAPPLWITLRIPDLSNPIVTIENVFLDKTWMHPDQNSVILMKYDPSKFKNVSHQSLQRFCLPSIVLDGFGHDLNSLSAIEDRCEIVSFLPVQKLVNSNKEMDYLGGYEDGYLEHISKSFWKSRSSGIKQILYKTYLMKKMITGHYPLSLSLCNLLVMILLDVTLGLCFTSYLLKFPNLYSVLHSKIEGLLTVLLKLLNWLRGSPAGLKLNAELNSLLWRFFSYHLHLWANYIGILEPILSFILSVIINIGMLGLTVQISLIKDLLSMATFHVYCLYIYASRLFSVQLSIIKSLGRLFLGRKWNPLRNRVDHVLLSKSEMFLGALGFTIGIFLSPTTIIYYVVFLSLRLPVIFVESVLSYFIDVLNTCRIVTNLLIIFNSSRVCDETYLQLIPNAAILTFRIHLQSTKSVGSIPKIGHALSNVIKDILQGKVLS